jgi:hypothetical protein
MGGKPPCHCRYDEEDDELEEGAVAPKSIGADLEALLEEAAVQFSQAHYRFRSLEEELDMAPPVGATQPDQVGADDAAHGRPYGLVQQ